MCFNLIVTQIANAVTVTGWGVWTDDEKSEQLILISTPITTSQSSVDTHTHTHNTHQDHTQHTHKHTHSHTTTHTPTHPPTPTHTHTHTPIMLSDTQKSMFETSRHFDNLAEQFQVCVCVCGCERERDRVRKRMVNWT